MIECKQSHIQQFFRIQGQITPDVLIPIIELIRDLMSIYIVDKFGTDWSVFADARVLTKSKMANFLIKGQVTRTFLVRLFPL